ncbi:LuxR C-terminal-related transcriptional regulator [Solirubrobacter phytolaccae]|uniref:LuxR C-terminal-related transcriptional regulator n=1 Tax=Solirubrobacter phytolaccae TaxID=1404360 RepID=UPI0022CE26B3|nr:LuxR C-terminal-related transcriptional regulator [Solirubrobacter phytolaccae]
MSVLVATKLHAPDLERGHVPRDVLVVRLAGGVKGRLALVCAPAGWGKTTLLSQWRIAERKHRPFAWVSLDAADDDPVRFWSYVVGAVRTVVPGFGGGTLAALPNAGPALIDVVLPRLINELAELETPVVLVLDDYHVIRDELVHASLAYLLQHTPRTLQLAIASRTEPPLSLPKLRAASQLVEIRADDLRFDDAEALSLLNGSLALGLAEEDVARLQERTEGWPAGLQLAALSLRTRTDRGAYVRELSGDDRQIGDFLGEVIDAAPERLREFLLRTAVLERMCAPLCEAVVGDPEAGALLDEAYRSNLFVVALDERGHWFRYHHLLRDLLRSELHRREGEAVRDLHARASAWHWRAGDVDDAIVHAIAAGEVETASDMIAAHWHPFLQTGPRTVERWLDGLGEEVVEVDARLCVARAWTLMLSGRFDAAEAVLDAAEQHPRRGVAPDTLGTLEGKVTLTRASLAYMRGDVGRTAALAGSALGEEAPAAKALAMMLLGAARCFGGDVAGAIEVLEPLRRMLEGAPAPQMRLTTLGTLAAVRLEAGEPEVAALLIADAERLVDESGFAESPTSSLICTGAGRLSEARGELDDAERSYARAAELAGRARWPLDGAHALLAHAALKRRRRDVAGARALVRDARAALATAPDPGALTDRLAALERTLQLAAPGPRERVDGDLSERELAVLRMLATDLSQREIGAELFVSFNTVKTHTKTVFRKLGVSSRADAVARGRELGLI